MKDAPIKPKAEEYAIGMGQRSLEKSAVTKKDAQALPRRKDFVVGIGRSKSKNARHPNAIMKDPHAAMKDAPTMPSKKGGFAEGMEGSKNK